MITDKFFISAGSIAGTSHKQSGKNNQDAYFIATEAEDIVAIVCDGGGFQESRYPRSSRGLCDHEAGSGHRCCRVIFRQKAQKDRRRIILSPVFFIYPKLSHHYLFHMNLLLEFLQGTANDRMLF